ncbi:MAG: SLC13 family permease, partial [Candidatus Helarchaeota archaeon]
LTITICRMLDVNPIPYILSEGMVVNLGGLLFVISSIPNLLISHSITWTFPQYFLDVGFFSLILFAITLTFLAVYNKNKLKEPKMDRVEVLLGYDAWLFVENKRNFFISLILLITTIISVIFLPLISKISIDLIALSGGVILIILTMRKDFHDLWKELDLELIFYLFCILFISEAIEYSGVLNFVSGGLESVTGGNELTLSLLLLWISGILSSGIHNAPITKIFIPIVTNLSTLGNERIFFSAVSIGTVLGENLSVMGDNLVLILMVRDYGYELKFSTFMRLGIIVTIIQLISSSIFLIMKILIQFIIFGIIILVFIGIIVYYHPKILKFLNKKFPSHFKKFK